jgi:hypothetical protein
MEKVKQRTFQTSKYLAAFALTTLIFILGILLGGNIAEGKLDQLSDLKQDITIKTTAMEVQFLLAAEQPCAVVHNDLLRDELFVLGSKLDFMEKQLGKKDERVLSLKEYYHLLEIRHWLFMEEVNHQCNQTQSTVLYFYSNLGDCSNCEQQGYVLNLLHKKGIPVNIYSFDINIENPALETLKKTLGIHEVPTLVVNKKTFTKLLDLHELEEAINS